MATTATCITSNCWKKNWPKFEAQRTRHNPANAMQRVDAPEILDSDACSPADVETSMRDLGRVNRWFGGVATTQKMVERVAQVSGTKQLSLLEVAGGSWRGPGLVPPRPGWRWVPLG